MRAGYTCKRKTSPGQSHEAVRLELVNASLQKPQDGFRIRQLLFLCMEREASVAPSKARALSVGTTRALPVNQRRQGKETRQDDWPRGPGSSEQTLNNVKETQQKTRETCGSSLNQQRTGVLAPTGSCAASSGDAPWCSLAAFSL